MAKMRRWRRCNSEEEEDVMVENQDGTTVATRMDDSEDVMQQCRRGNDGATMIATMIATIARIATTRGKLDECRGRVDN